MRKEMKKLLGTGLAGISIATMLSGCAGTEGVADTAQVSAADNSDAAVVGFIFVGAKDDYGYNKAAYLGSLAVEEKFGDKVKVLRSENVPETEEASRTLEQMIQQGATVLFPTSYGHLYPAMDVAEKHPDLVFYHQGGLECSDNLGTYFGTIYEPYYLAGMAAGAATESDKLGFVGSFPIPQVIENINAFELGAKAMNPDVTTTVIFTSSWSDPALQTSAANSLIDSGCDVIAQHQDSTKTIIELCEDKGVYAVGYHADASELAPNMWLTAAIWKWDELFCDMAETAIEGKFDGSIYDGKYRAGIAEGVVDLASFGPSVSQETKDAINEVKQKMIDGTFSAFSGLIKDQNGNVVCEDGHTMTVDEAESMNYFVEGVIGTIEE